MKYFLVFIAIILFNVSLSAFAHDTDVMHEEPTAPVQRSNEVSPAAVTVFGIAIAGAGGYFVWLKLKQGKEPPKQDPGTKV